MAIAQRVKRSLYPDLSEDLSENSSRMPGQQVAPFPLNPNCAAVAGSFLEGWLRSGRLSGWMRWGIWGGFVCLFGCGNAPEPVPLPPPPAHPADRILVAYYHPDPRCETLVRSPLRVPRNRAIQASVEAVIQQARSSDLDIQSYRLTLDPAQRRAQVALRFHPDRRRPWSSLSPCEQLTLFGSLRDTLTRNSAWDVEQVEFQNLENNVENQP